MLCLKMETSREIENPHLGTGDNNISDLTIGQSFVYKYECMLSDFNIFAKFSIFTALL